MLNKKQRGIYSEYLVPDSIAKNSKETKKGPNISDIVNYDHMNTKNQFSVDKLVQMFSNNDIINAEITRLKECTNIISEGDQTLVSLEPKALEPFEPVPERVPRKVEIERKKRKYLRVDIEGEMIERGLDRRLKSIKANRKMGWLGLEKFDNQTYDDYSNEEWFEKAQILSGKREIKIPVSAIWLRNDKFAIKEAILEDYNSKEWLGYWKDTGMPDKFKRINFCFEAENPYKWIDRIENAINLRQKFLVDFKTCYLMDKMKTDEVNNINSEQLSRVLNQSLDLNKLKDIKTAALVNDLKHDYQRVMNKLIFKTYYKQMGDKFDISDVIDRLSEKDTKKKKNAPENGIVKFEIDTKNLEGYSEKHVEYKNPINFEETFKAFCFSSLFIKDESINALKEISTICKSLDTMSFFVLEFSDKTVKRLDEFKTIQESSITTLISFLKTTWVGRMTKVIHNSFDEVGKGWFNLKETNRLTYDFGKLKRFLTAVRFMMQDSLKKLLEKSLKSFVNFFDENIPEIVHINSECEVENSFTMVSKAPVLSIDIVQVPNKTEFHYLFKKDKIKADIQGLIVKAVEELQKIPDIEPKVLDTLHKAKKHETYVLTPILPMERQKDPDPNAMPKRYPDENIWLWDLYVEIGKKLEKPLESLEEYRRQFSKHERILGLKAEDIIKEIDSEKIKDSKAVEEIIKKWQTDEKKIRKKVPEDIHVSCFNVNCKEAIRILISKYQEINKKLLEALAKRVKESNALLQKKVVDLEKQVMASPNDIEELSALQNFVSNELPGHIESLKNESQQCVDIYELLEKQGYKLPKEILAARWELIKGPKNIYEQVKSKEKIWTKLTYAYEENLNHDKDEFDDSIKNIDNIIKGFYVYSDISNHNEITSNAIGFKETLENMIQQARKFNHHEKLFNFVPTDYSKIQEMLKGFIPYVNLWKIMNEWLTQQPIWMNDALLSIDAISAERFVEDGLKTLNSSIRQLKEKAKMLDKENEFKKLLEIGNSIKKEIDDFKSKVPLLMGIKREGMLERHWDEIRSRTQINFKVDDNLTFDQLIKLGLLEHTSLCIEIGEKANKEFAIQKALEQMKMEWETIDFDMRAFKNTGSFVITSFDLVESVLDQHLSETQSLLVNPFRAVFGEEIDKWYDHLLLISNIIEEWRRFQGQWCYLQPIFDSPDINKQLPNESAMFKRVDTTWRQAISQTKIQKNVLKVCLGEDYYDKFKEANNSFDLIQKELKSYLELKRSKFGRFYFLSNDDLLSILSQTKDVERIQDHLRKVFESIARLQFDEEKKIRAMYSVEQEKVDFGSKIVDPNLKQVEDWMREVEESMVSSVKDRLRNSIEDYINTDRNEWILKHPGQCVLNGSQILWTRETEQAIETRSLPEYFEALENQLKKLILIDRKNLSKNQFVTIEALIVIDVHAKDVVERLVASEIEYVSAFEWISQLRYYWQDNDCRVKCIQTDFPYGYEYLGNSIRLVITPLTDKCYMTLMSALKLNLGGAPAGPAGTGKTETTKDLAKALAKQCVVFNCQESMDYKFVAKFFKGLVSSGAWCCFDEFNRINLEVLSVIAQQLQELFKARAANLNYISFEGSELKMKPTFSVFITMNPGYAGRTELPDNLKALFRPVAMMVPDYALIAEIKLYSFGFINARELARKMVATFKLSSEQLSSQNHYDYGMRAVISVINAAGFLIRQNLCGGDEEQILLKALNDVNVPKFLKQDLPLFDNIIKDLFPSASRPEFDQSTLVNTIKSCCHNMNIQPKTEFVDKILQLNDTIQVRHGLMLVGPTGGGKTTTYKVLQSALSHMHIDEGIKVNVEIINPKSIDMAQLYGEYKDMNWQEGIVELVFEKAINNQYDESKGQEKYWIMFDGPVDALWIESMNTVLDDNKKLCLSSGKVLILSQQMTIMFEVEDLSEASPATVSRCGMVYLDPVALGNNVIIDSFVNVLKIVHNDNDQMKEKLLYFIKIFVLGSLEYMRAECQELISTPDNNLICSFTRIFKSYVKENENYFLNKEYEDSEILIENLANLTLFSSIWSICCTVTYESRLKITKYLSNIISQDSYLDSIMKIKDDFYDFQYNLKSNSFTSWLEDKDSKTLIDPSLNFNEIKVPTLDSERMISISTLLVKNKYCVITPGTTGTGKSTNFYELMANHLNDNYISTSIVLSAKSSSDQIIDLILNQIAKRKKGIFGPPSGKRLVLFVDDLNMPKKEQYGAQPPIEILRQYLDHSAWYMWKLNKEYIEVEDIILLGAMSATIGSKSNVTQRFIRHFNVLAYTELEQKIVKNIFTTIVNVYINNFNDQIKDIMDRVIQTSLDLYNKIRNDLPPIPSKGHYQFNMRDLSRFFNGICSASPKYLKTKEDFLKLWYHESLRVFHDRLVSINDQSYLISTARSFLQDFDADIRMIINDKRLIFTDFHTSEPERPYCCIDNMEQLVNRLKELQEDYNNETTSARNKMNLVLFNDACEHVTRICRVLRQPQGHALLLGVGGSGKQSLSKLSVFIADQTLFTIEVVKGYNISKWKEDLKRLIYMAVTEDKQFCFLLNDNQITDEEMLEDINCLLNTGTIVRLPFTTDEQKVLDEAGRLDCIARNIQPNKINIFQQQINRIRKNTHVIFCMSPLGEEFWTRLRNFPALINCCTIDWFMEWPEDALQGVASEFLEVLIDEINFDLSPRLLVDFFKYSHKYVEKLNLQFKKETKRINYVTPKSYLELLMSYKEIIKEKRNENFIAIERLKNGVQRLRDANEAVEKLQEELKEEEPELIKTEEEVKRMVEKIQEDKEVADKKKSLVAEEEAQAKIAQEEAAELARQVQEQVEEADIELAKTLEKIGLLNQGHINEIKSFDKPPEKVKYVFMAACVLLMDQSSISYKSSMSEEEVEQFFWKLSKSELLKDPQFLTKLKGLDFSKVEPWRIKKMKEIVITHPKRSKTWIDTEMQKSNIANYCLFLLVNSVIKYNELYEKTKPLRKQQEDVLEELKLKQQLLEEKNRDLNELNSKLEHLEKLLMIKNNEMSQLKARIKNCSERLSRAKKLTTLLSEENTRWTEDIKELQASAYLIEGNSLLASAMLSYAGPFNSKYRKLLENELRDKLIELKIPIIPHITMRSFLGKELSIQSWNIAGLPKDDTSIENGIIIEYTKRWPFIIDPQKQALKFLKNIGKEHDEGIEIAKVDSNNLLKLIEQCVQFGKRLVIENCHSSLDPAWEPILLKQISKSGGSYQIMIGDKFIPYNDNFRLFLCCNESKPNFMPETCAKVTIINFSITPNGLEEQMLATIVILENRQLEDQKNEIIRKNALDRQTLVGLEDNILKTLSECDNSSFLENSNLIEQLAESKRTASAISQRVVDSRIFEKKIDIARETYRPLAQRVSLLFFTVLNLTNIDRMYEFSLQWFDKLFKNSVEITEASNEIEIRLKNLTNTFTYMLYKNVCRSLFEDHKLLFSFVLASTVLKDKGILYKTDIDFLIGDTLKEENIENNPTNYINDNEWPSFYRLLVALSMKEEFQSIKKNLFDMPDIFKDFYLNSDPHENLLPESIKNIIKKDPVNRLMFFKVFRPDKFLPAVQTFIAETMGKKFVEVPTVSFEDVYDDSNCFTPIILLLSQGSDPKADFDRLVEDKGIRDVMTISLGQGQGKNAEKMLQIAVKTGTWVLLQNCHLAASWMNTLDNIVQRLAGNTNIHDDFRLWLTTMPSDAFPISILQSGIRVTLEPPKGLKATLLRAYDGFEEKEFNEQPDNYKKLVYGLCFFHAVIQNRKNFGPIGWNIPYEFTFEDLFVCQKQLQTMLTEYKHIPYKVLNFVCAEINYGGRVTDDKDLKLIKSLLKVYICPEILKDNYKLSASDLYKSVPPGNLETYIETINSFDLNIKPEVFWLHENAEITTNENNTRNFIQSMIDINHSSIADEDDKGSMILADIIKTIEAKIPNTFDYGKIIKEYPTAYNESMNTVLTQEVLRYNNLLKIMKAQIIELKNALKGLVSFSSEIQDLVSNLSFNKVPSSWSYPNGGYLSLKPLNSWIDDLNRRIIFLNDWIDHGKPNVFWFSGFFFPQAFITGTLQNYARKTSIAIDKLGFIFKIKNEFNPELIKYPPENGIYIYGLFLEGASWDSANYLLADPKPKELFSPLPIIHLEPIRLEIKNVEQVFNCPLYKTVSRAGTLSTTGHSTNFVMNLELPSDRNEDIWIRRGVASFLSLRY